MRYTIAGLIFWLTCGFFAWGISLAESRSRNAGWETISHIDALDCRHDQAFSAVWGEGGGPLSLGVSLAVSGFAEHGMQWTCPDRADRRKEKE